ncbi:putative glycosidase CRH2 [Coemansia asiatica]|uniref:Glycosidase CRH2 n=1 Tax=Coemansia asiatica TaxID=1052880 RepID=A0A9W7XJW4_9FUNG|nr:putative glycosidase CRH2 [Coemansia asiatica]
MTCNITLTAIAVAALLQTALGAKCGSQDCGKDTPCCVKGYCNSNAMYCMPINCEAANSYSPGSCWDTAHCVNANVNFGSSNSFAQIADYDGNPSSAAFVSQFEPSNAKQANNELELTLVKQGDGKGFGATVINTRAIQYGTVTTVMRSGCLSGGVVSSFIIRNDRIGDEIDFEFVGADKSTVQSNYYWHDQLDYTKMIKSPVVADTTANYHTYGIQWTPDKIVWSVNGNAFRTVNRADTWDSASNTFKYPDAEAYVSYSIWDGGSGAKGTSDWAGGAIQWGQGPFVMGVKSLTIDCYYKGNETTYKPPSSAGGKTSDSEENDSSADDSSDDDKSSSEKSSTKSSNSTKSIDTQDDTADEQDSVGDDANGEQQETATDGEVVAGTAFDAESSDARALIASVGSMAAALVAAYLF